MAQSARDQNRVTTIIGVSSVDVETPTRIAVDPVTNELLVQSTSPTSLSSYSTNNVDEASSTVTYIGKETISGDWLIMKIDTSSGTAFTYASISNNPTLTTYILAWAGRTTATYNQYGAL